MPESCSGQCWGMMCGNFSVPEVKSGRWMGLRSTGHANRTPPKGMLLFHHAPWQCAVRKDTYCIIAIRIPNDCLFAGRFLVAVFCLSLCVSLDQLKRSVGSSLSLSWIFNCNIRRACQLPYFMGGGEMNINYWFCMTFLIEIPFRAIKTFFFSCDVSLFGAAWHTFCYITYDKVYQNKNKCMKKEKERNKKKNRCAIVPTKR